MPGNIGHSGANTYELVYARNMASSRGHRDCVIVDLPGGGPAENTPGHGVDAVFDGAQVGVAEAGQIGALADVAADEAVAVLVRGAMPRAMSVGRSEETTSEIQSLIRHTY